ncbi:hypothetical protein QE407_004808 [Pantoea dispersa]|nr:hypothetical protein [Pantoea dispersa]
MSVYSKGIKLILTFLCSLTFLAGCSKESYRYGSDKAYFWISRVHRWLRMNGFVFLFFITPQWIIPPH